MKCPNKTLLTTWWICVQHNDSKAPVSDFTNTLMFKAQLKKTNSWWVLSPSNITGVQKSSTSSLVCKNQLASRQLHKFGTEAYTSIVSFQECILYSSVDTGSMITRPSIVNLLAYTVYLSSNQQLIPFLLFLKLIFLLNQISSTHSNGRRCNDVFYRMFHDHNITNHTRVVLLMIADKS